MYDRLPEEKEYEVEVAWNEKIYKIMDLFDQVTSKLKGCGETPFYVVGVNHKTKMFTYKRVKNREEAYKTIIEKGLTQYIFAEYIFNSFNTNEG